MRILHVTAGLPPHRQGGSEIYCLSLARAQSDAGLAVAIFSLEKPALRPPVPVFDAAAQMSSSLRLWNPAVESSFRKALRTFRPQIVHFHAIGRGLSLRMPAIAQQSGAQNVFTLHDYCLICPRGQMLAADYTLCERAVPNKCATCITQPMPLPASLKAPHAQHTCPLSAHRPSASLFARMAAWRAMMSKLRDAVGAFIAPSRFLLEKYAGHGFLRSRLFYSANGIEDLRLNRVPTGQGLRVALIGSITPAKGVHTAVEAMRILQERPVELSIWGASADPEQDYAEMLRRRAAGLKVRFCGCFRPAETGKVLGRADVLVFPSIWFENSPLVIHQAHAAKLPVVASRLGAINELVRDRIDGLLFDPANAARLSEKLLLLLEQPEFRARLSASAPRPRSILEQAAELADIYRMASGCA